MVLQEIASAEAEPKSEILAELRWQGRCLSVLATIAIGLTLYILRPVLAPFVVAVFLTVGLKPVLDFLQHRLLPSRLIAVTVAFLLGVVFVVALSGAIVSSVEELGENNDYMTAASDAAKWFAEFTDRIGLLPKAEEGDAKLTSIQRLEEAAVGAAKMLQDWLLGGMFTLSSSLGVVLIYMFFLLLGASDAERPSSELWTMIEANLREYIVLKTAISLVTGVTVWLVLAMFGVPLAFLLGLLTFLLNYIPNFGPLITCLLPLPLIVLSPELGVFAKGLAILLSCGVQLVGGNVIEPRLMGSSFDLHPIVVLLALMLWFAIWGFVGMLLAVPITAALKVVLQRMKRTEPIARVLAGDLSAIAVETA